MSKILKYLAILLIAFDIGAIGFAGIKLTSTNKDKQIYTQKINKPAISPIIQTKEETNAEHIKRQIVRCTVKIHYGASSGTGVVFYQDKDIAYIITANHVINSYSFPTNFSVFAEYHNNINTILEECKVIKSSRDIDMAILSSKPVWEGAAEVIKDEKEVEQFAEAFTYGFAGGFSEYIGILTHGEIQAVKSSELLSREHCVTTIPVIFGNSGGGMFIKVNGNYKLAGIMTNVHLIRHSGTDIIVCHISMATTATQILEFIKNNK